MIALAVLLRFLGWTVCLIPLQLVLLAIRAPLSKRLPMVWHQGVCRIFGFRMERYGTVSRTVPTLFVCNHTSYLDISALGAVVPGSFVAKAEVRSWPMFGFLAILQRTVFVERRASRTAHHRDNMAARLESGDNLILFPEGTSNDGNRVLPFKSAFFGIAEKPVRGKPLTVQPVSIAYTRLNGIPMGRPYRPFYAWYGDMELASHLWTVAGLGNATIAIQFHPPVTIEQFAPARRWPKPARPRLPTGSPARSAASSRRRSGSASGRRGLPENFTPASHCRQDCPTEGERVHGLGVGFGIVAGPAPDLGEPQGPIEAQRGVIVLSDLQIERAETTPAHAIDRGVHQCASDAPLARNRRHAERHHLAACAVRAAEHETQRLVLPPPQEADTAGRLSDASDQLRPPGLLEAARMQSGHRRHVALADRLDRRHRDAITHAAVCPPRSGRAAAPPPL